MVHISSSGIVWHLGLFALVACVENAVIYPVPK